jgi:RNA polymerase sigma-70 factor, ECF subfamily
MTDLNDLDQLFEQERPRLVGLAYRITGSRVDADDIVQDAWLRWQATDRSAVERPAAWLTTVTSRIALDRLRSAQHRRERYVGPWLPEVAMTTSDPADQVELVESLTIGFLTVLERLSPVERVVFLLADVFQVPFAEIAEVVDRTPEACRQVASRARRRVAEARPRFSATDDEAWQVTAAFLDAAVRGDLDALTAVLAPDVVELSDGGSARRAGRRPVVGIHRVSRLVLNLVKRDLRPDMEVQLALVNGQPGVIVTADGEVDLALACSVVDGLVDRIWVVLNPEKLAGVPAPEVR